MKRSRSSGFTYLALLIAVAITAGALAAAGGLYSHVSQREKERELLFIGEQFRQAIALYYWRTPGGAGIMGVYSKSEGVPIKTAGFPTKLESFVEARNYSDWKFVFSPETPQQQPRQQQNPPPPR